MILWDHLMEENWHGKRGVPGSHNMEGWVGSKGEVLVDN